MSNFILINDDMIIKELSTVKELIKNTYFLKSNSNENNINELELNYYKEDNTINYQLNKLYNKVISYYRIFIEKYSEDKQIEIENGIRSYIDDKIIMELMQENNYSFIDYIELKKFIKELNI